MNFLKPSSTSKASLSAQAAMWTRSDHDLQAFPDSVLPNPGAKPIQYLLICFAGPSSKHVCPFINIPNPSSRSRSETGHHGQISCSPSTDPAAGLSLSEFQLQCTRASHKCEAWRDYLRNNSTRMSNWGHPGIASSPTRSRMPQHSGISLDSNDP